MPDTVFELLTRRYPPREYALMSEVSDDAGFNRSRSADFLLVGLWPSRGLHMSGIELKSHRSDWLRELKQREKAENIFKYCDFFWLLTTDEAVAKQEEIPSSWGWMCIKGNKIHVIKDAPKLENKPVSRGFLAAMLKRANDKTDYVHKSEIEDKIKEAKEQGKEISDREHGRFTKDHESLKNYVKDFEEASGIDIKSSLHNWGGADPKKVGQAVKYIVNNGIDGYRNQLQGLELTAKNVLERINNELKAL
jgi:hypothetical protein